MTNYFYIVIFIFGLAVGSYLNVLIYRVPLRLDTVKGRSFCPRCGHKLAALDLFPVISFLLLRGKCRYCAARISPSYMAVELANALLYLLYAVKFGVSAELLGYFVFASSLICVFLIDAKHFIIPDRFNAAIAAAGIFFGIMDALSSDFPSVLARVIGFFSVSLIFYLIAFFSRGKAMGGGDIKLAAAAGLVLGWKNMLLALFLSALLGALISGSVYYAGKIRKKEVSNIVPFGSYLAVGFIAVSFFGEPLLDLYMRFAMSIIQAG